MLPVPLQQVLGVIIPGVDSPWQNTALLYFQAALATLAVAAASFYWWKRSESARVRKIVRRDCLGGCLPTFPLVLPRWGFIGGHTLLIKPRQIASQLEGWAKGFGGDYELHIFGYRTVVVTGPADIRRILTLRPARFKRGFSTNRLNWVAIEAGVYPSMFFIEGKQWGRSRRLISPNLNGHNVAAMLPHISKIGERLCAKLGAFADAGEVVDAPTLLEHFTHDIIALAAFGIDVNSLSATPDRPCPSYDAIQSITALINDLARRPMKRLQWKTLHSAVPWVRASKEKSRRLDVVVQGAIDTMRREADRTAPGDDDATAAGPDSPLPVGTLLRKIVAVRKGKSESNRMVFTDDEVHREVKSLFIAGTETTALSLSWVMYYLAVHPDAFARCRAEGLQAATSSEGMVSTSEQLSRLVFCSAVFKEAVRLRTPAPFLILHSPEDYTMKSGYVVDKGASMLLLNRAASVSDDSFTRGGEFVPERWIEAERKTALLGQFAGTGGTDDRSVRHAEEAFLGFGGGPRVCPGQDMARAEASVIIAAICARFDISLAPGQPDPPAEVNRFTLRPEAVRLAVTRRAS